jgi:hypothetical protein
VRPSVCGGQSAELGVPRGGGADAAPGVVEWTMFASAWAALAEKAEGSSWICLSHRLDSAWLAAVRADSPATQVAGHGRLPTGTRPADELIHTDY